MFTIFKLLTRLIKWMAIITCLIATCLAVSGVFFLYQLNKELPDDLREFHQPEDAHPIIIYDRNGTRIEEIFIHRQIIIPFEKFPTYLIQALLASEDNRFFSHYGIDPSSILKALWSKIDAMPSIKDSSTLTQKTARLFLWRKDGKLISKFKEILLALQIERQFSKEAIIALYLNRVFLGTAEGVESAARVYFGKHAEELNLSECALLVGLLSPPLRNVPTVNSTLVKKRRDFVLERMFENGFISIDERESARKEPIQFSKNYDSVSVATAYYVEHIRKNLLQRYGPAIMNKGGLRVHSAMDLEYQIYAYEALQKGILELSRRQGFRGPSERIKMNLQGQLPPWEIHRVTHKNKMILGGIIQGVVSRVSKEKTKVSLGSVDGYLDWANLKKWKVAKLAQNSMDLPSPDSLPRGDGQGRKVVSIKNPSQILQEGDVIHVKLEDWDPANEEFRLTLHQEPLVNGAIFSMDPRTGEVLAMSGGYHYDPRGVNRAIEVEHQAGSVFKPFVYASALDSGYTLASLLVDSPRHYHGESDTRQEESWTADNFGNKLMGNVSLRTALVNSLNPPTIGLVEDLKPGRIINYAKKFGISSEMKNSLSIGLGSFSTTLEEIVTAFSVFANEGTLSNPIYIRRIEDLNGLVLEEKFPQNNPVISKATAYLILDVMRDVVQDDTGRITRYSERPSAGISGKTFNSVDAWYIGFIPQLITGVNVGFDQAVPMEKGETSAKSAAPIWVNYMKSASRDLPPQRFVRPPQIVSVKIHKSGRRSSPCDPGEENYYEKFKRGTEPLMDSTLVQQCNLQQKTPAFQKNDLEL